MMIRLSHITAVAKNDVIGHHGGLPWSLPEDMNFFRETTKNKALIMGRKTFESIGHPLPHRFNLVVTRQKNYKAEGAVVTHDIPSAIEICKTKIDIYGEEIFIIGGGEIYKQSMDLVDTIYLTRIHKDFEGDVKYPKIDLSKFEEIRREERTEPIPFTFLTYKKRD